ncbi:MAG: trimethylamine methyltransferase family protein [Candidatus Heimdallarchaeota archaeon]
MKQPKIKILDQEDIQQIIEAAYDLLENFGVKVDNQEVLQTLANGGAKVDFEQKVAFISPSMVDKALKTVPSSFNVYDQACKNAAVLEGDNIHFCGGSVALNILDSDTEKIRKPKLSDLIRITSLIETLEHLSFVTGTIMPNDIPAPLQDAYRYYLLMLNTSKPLFSGAFTVGGLRVQIEMLKVLRGGEDKLRTKPRAIFAANPTAPLQWGGIVAQNLVDSARANIPVMLIPMPLPGGNAPVTLAGALTEHTAENLSGIVITQLVNPGTPVLYGGGAIVLEMRYGTSCIGAIESHLMGIGYSQIGKALGLPTASNIGQSDSKRVDAQAGLESGIGILLAALAGINLSRGPGMLAFANCQSFEKLVIDNNICGMALRLIRGVECNKETIGLDIIKAAGRGAKDYLFSPHTLKWFKKELFFPTKIIDRRAIQTGAKFSTAWERAKEEVKARLAEYEPAHLPDDKAQEIKAIMHAYARSKGVEKLPDITGTGWDG